MTGLPEGLHANCRAPREKWLGETWHDGQREERGHSHYLNETPLNELLVSGKKAMIDLREDHLSRCVRSRGRRSEVREGWRRMKVPEGGGGGRGRQMQKETEFVRKACVHQPWCSAFTDGGRNPQIHTFPAKRWFASEVWAFFSFHFLGGGEPGPIITT